MFTQKISGTKYARMQQFLANPKAEQYRMGKRELNSSSTMQITADIERETEWRIHLYKTGQEDDNYLQCGDCVWLDLSEK